MRTTPNPVYPIEFRIEWRKFPLFEIGMYDTNFDWEDRHKQIWIYLPVIYVSINKQWVTNQRGYPYVSSYPDDNDNWDEIPF